jgi:GR25 family glycosyltransferase involved in LPS biosynthesis
MNKNIINILNNYEVVLENVNNNNNSFLKIPIYIINLNTNYLRRGYIKYITKRLGLNYTLVIVNPVLDNIKDSICCKTKNGIIGCFLSHLWCIKHAISNKFEHFLILEDDIVFHKNFEILFKKLNYKQYDMIQLGCSDFNLKKNVSKNIITKDLQVYNPTYIALGAFGNIYNINFAKIIYEEKINNFKEFDTTFDMYYNKYNIGICLPNLVITELSTSNLGHEFSLFKDDCSNNYFKKSCYIDISYDKYYLLWIIFIELCYDYFKENGKNALTFSDYFSLIDNFSSKYMTNCELIKNTLMNNEIYFYDIMEIFTILETDIYMDIN